MKNKNKIVFFVVIFVYSLLINLTSVFALENTSLISQDLLKKEISKQKKMLIPPILLEMFRWQCLIQIIWLLQEMFTI